MGVREISEAFGLECEHVRLRDGRVARVVRLTGRHHEVLRLICQGKATNKEIAQRLEIAPATAREHVRALLSLTQTTNRVQLCIWGLQHPDILRIGSGEWFDHLPGCDCGSIYCQVWREAA